MSSQYRGLMTRGVALGCLCVVLALPLSARAEFGTRTFRVSGWIEPTSPLTDVCVIWGYGMGAAYFNPLYLDGTFPANTRTTFSADFELFNDDMMPTWYLPYYGVFGLHDSANDGVTVAMAPARAQAAVSGGGTWEQAWWPGWNPTPTEQQISNWLRTEIDSIPLLDLMGLFDSNAYQGEGYVSQRVGVESSLVSYSTASAGGSAFVGITLVPEPATLVFATLAGAVLLPRRRRSPA